MKKTLMFMAALTIAAGFTFGVETRVGVIGLDTSHTIAFTKMLNVETNEPYFKGFRVTAAYKYGSLDIPSSTNRYPKYIKQMEDMGVKIVDTLPELLKETDVILLETNDGRRHLEQALEVFKAGKRVFIDKPLAVTLADVIAIFKASEKYNVPMFSSSALRYVQKVQDARAGEFGRIIAVDAYSPCTLEPTHPGMVWYGIHGVETLYAVKGTGCVSVVSANAENTDLAVGIWNDGRVSTMRGMRGKGAAYGGEVFAEKGGRIYLGGYEGYKPLLMEIVKFFKTGEVPIPPAETIEMFAFMEAAEESKQRGGVPVKIADIMARAQAEAAKIKLD